MCGRYRLSRRKQVLEEHFGTEPWEDEWEPRYNIAPTQPVPVVRKAGESARRNLSLFRWGLVPSWASDTTRAASLINARSETVATKPAFADAVRFRRCLVPADGFYEWQKRGKTKQPFCFEVDRGRLFAFAGLWDSWRNREGEPLETCSILTTSANAVAAPIHNRMPVIVGPEDYDLWLDPSVTDTTAVSKILRPFDPQHMNSYPVSSRINKSDVDDEECSKPVEIVTMQSSLFQ